MNVTIDPYVEYERLDPDTGEAIGRGMTLRSTVEQLIKSGEPLRITTILTPYVEE
jgi:hypothetical protein